MQTNIENVKIKRTTVCIPADTHLLLGEELEQREKSQSPVQ